MIASSTMALVILIIAAINRLVSREPPHHYFWFNVLLAGALLLIPVKVFPLLWVVVGGWVYCGLHWLLLGLEPEKEKDETYRLNQLLNFVMINLFVSLQIAAGFSILGIFHLVLGPVRLGPFLV